MEITNEGGPACDYCGFMVTLYTGGVGNNYGVFHEHCIAGSERFRTLEAELKYHEIMGKAEVEFAMWRKQHFKKLSKDCQLDKN